MRITGNNAIRIIEGAPHLPFNTPVIEHGLQYEDMDLVGVIRAQNRFGEVSPDLRIKWVAISLGRIVFSFSQMQVYQILRRTFAGPWTAPCSRNLLTADDI